MDTLDLAQAEETDLGGGWEVGSWGNMFGGKNPAM